MVPVFSRNWHLEHQDPPKKFPLRGHRGRRIRRPLPPQPSTLTAIITYAWFGPPVDVPGIRCHSCLVSEEPRGHADLLSVVTAVSASHLQPLGVASGRLAYFRSSCRRSPHASSERSVAHLQAPGARVHRSRTSCSRALPAPELGRVSSLARLFYRRLPPLKRLLPLERVWDARSIASRSE